MTIFVTSDEHYDHKNIISYCARPFSDVSHMIETMIWQHNEAVSPQDVVYHVGDFVMNPKNLKILSRLQGQHHLVSGNHDYVHPCRSQTKIDRYTPVYLDAGFKSIQAQVILSTSMGDVKLCHMPYTGDSHHDDRFVSHRPVKGAEALLIHGHVHEKWKFKSGMANAGVDVWDFRPVSLETLVSEYLKYSA